MKRQLRARGKKTHAASALMSAHIDELLDEALKQTFPASDAIAVDIERAPDGQQTQPSPGQLRLAYLRRRGHSWLQPDGWHTVTPRIVTSDAAGLVGFLRAVFDADGELRCGAPTELKIGDSFVMISQGGGVREARPAFLYVYVKNADETYQRAMTAGAESIERPADMPYGDRRATVRDAWANIWQIATFRRR